MIPDQLLTSEVGKNTLTSTNGRYIFKVENDGNLVLYDQTIPIWESRTSNTGEGGPYVFRIHYDCLLYLKDKEENTIWRSLKICSGSNNQAKFIVQDDGNAVAYRRTRQIWSTSSAENLSN